MPQKRSANRINTLKTATVDKLTGEGELRMELKQIVGRITESIPMIDSTTQIQNHNRRNKRPYIKGVPTLWEPQFVKELVGWWRKNHGDELSDINDEFPYPTGTTARGRGETCDVVLTGEDTEVIWGNYEWAVEIKYLRLVGNNGNNNDYVMQKAISPYLKDRSLVHDIEKIKGASFAKRRAVVFYGFEFDSDSVQHAEEVCIKIRESMGESDFYIEQPDELDLFYSKDMDPIPRNLGRVIRSVDVGGGTYSLEPMTEIIDSFLRIKGLSTGDPEVRTFDGLQRHPCGRFGRVVGWEIK